MHSAVHDHPSRTQEKSTRLDDNDVPGDDTLHFGVGCYSVNFSVVSGTQTGA